MSAATLNTLGMIGTVCAVIIFLWFALKRLRAASDPGELVVRWVVTVAAVAFWVYLGIKTKRSDPLTTFFNVCIAAGSAIFVGAMWAPRIGEILASPFTRLYDGGDAAPDPKPMYSIAIGYRKRGNHQKAIAEVNRQLAMFPEDFEGWMLLTDIQFKDLRNVPAALETIEQILAIPEIAPKNVAFALATLGDWQLELGDRDAAQQAFERIIELLPDTEEAHVAAQRLAHLASPEHMANLHEPRIIVVPRGDDRLGLRGETVAPPPPEDANLTASRFLDHLRDHPLDNEVREKLAMLYASEFKRLDLATVELEELIANPNQSAKNVAHWLNLLADFQIRLANDIDIARQTLQRIIDRDPKSAAANNAAVRLSQLRLELNQNSVHKTLKLGTYEQNIGLKRASSARPNDTGA